MGGVGVVTTGETANSLSFPNEPESGSWHWLDAAGMVRPFVPLVTNHDTESPIVPATSFQQLLHVACIQQELVLFDTI